MQHDPRALHILERQLLGPRDPLKLATLALTELNPVTGRARHPLQDSTRAPEPLHKVPTDTSGHVY
jgi:hypothetical protein